MIVVSGVLVIVALVFLVIGLLGDGLTFIWASIITSVVAGVFLLLGALQRRGAPAAAVDAGPAPDTTEHVTAVNVRPRAEAPAAAVALVSVVPGRPRYHVESCRFLTGRPDVETVPVDQARTEGYTACGVCKPDAALEAAAAAAPEVPAAVEAEPADAEVTTLLETPPAKKAAAASRTSRSTTTAKAAPAKSAAKAAPAKAAPAKVAAAPAKAAAAPTKAAAKAAPAKAAPAKAVAGQVVVIPDRGKFHTETCRFVKDVPGTLTIAKATAKRQGYTACGVCKP